MARLPKVLHTRGLCPRLQLAADRTYAVPSDATQINSLLRALPPRRTTHSWRPKC
jgi:hypothetical protein